jgi:hypothetical protein
MLFWFHGAIGARNIFPGHQMRYDQSALHKAKTIPGCLFLTEIFIQERLMPAEGVTILTNNQVGGIRSHLPHERGIQGLHHSERLGRDTMPSSERGSLGGAESNRVT